jgi:hypothetical protein
MCFFLYSYCLCYMCLSACYTSGVLQAVITCALCNSGWCVERSSRKSEENTTFCPDCSNPSHKLKGPISRLGPCNLYFSLKSLQIRRRWVGESTGDNLPWRSLTDLLYSIVLLRVWYFALWHITNECIVIWYKSGSLSNAWHGWLAL